MFDVKSFAFGVPGKRKYWYLYAVLLDTNEMINQRINYIHENPVRALIVGDAREYLFSLARDFAGEKGPVKQCNICYLIVGDAHEYLFSSPRDFAGEKGYVYVQVEV